MDFLAEGIHLKTADTTSNRRSRVLPGDRRPPHHAVHQWYGTGASNQPVPRSSTTSTTTGNDNDSNALVGELFYATNVADQPLTDSWSTGGPAFALTNGNTVPLPPAVAVRMPRHPRRVGGCLTAAKPTVGGFSTGVASRATGSLRAAT